MVDGPMLVVVMLGVLALAALLSMAFRQWKIRGSAPGFSLEVEGSGGAHGRQDVSDSASRLDISSNTDNSGGAQVLTGIANSAADGDQVLDEPGTMPNIDGLGSISIRSETKDSPDAQVITGIGNRAQRSGSTHDRGEARGKAR